MPAPDGIDAAQAQIIREILDRELPGYDLVSVDRPSAPPAPPGTDDRREQENVPRTPPLESLQAHYRDLGVATDRRHMPEPRRPAPVDDRKDPGILRCRVKARNAAGPGEEIDVLISIADRTILHR